MDIYKINFKKWLDEEDFDPDIKKELQSLKEELRASETNGAAGAESREKAEAEIKERFEKELRFGNWRSQRPSRRGHEQNKYIYG